MFNHGEIREYDFSEVPTGRDVFLVDEKSMEGYGKYFLDIMKGVQSEAPGYVSYAVVRQINEGALELSWYPNIEHRFHEVTVLLPRSKFVGCAECSNFDEKPHIFVESEWLSTLHLRPYSAFALVDAVGVKSAITNGKFDSTKLGELRTRIDGLAKSHPEVAFVSFADSILLKSRWQPGYFEKNKRYDYEPEILLKLFPEIASIYRGIFAMEIYAAVTEGGNEYLDEALLHVSTEGNHICLNSLGLPFAHLLAIENAARDAIRCHRHEPAELYLDEHFYHSIRFRFGFEKQAQPNYTYTSPFSKEEKKYYFTSCENVLSNLRKE